MMKTRRFHVRLAGFTNLKIFSLEIKWPIHSVKEPLGSKRLKLIFTRSCNYENALRLSKTFEKCKWQS